MKKLARSLVNASALAAVSGLVTSMGGQALAAHVGK